MNTAAGRVFDLQLHLLDRQLVAADDHLIGKVDDLDLTPSDDDPGVLYVTGILTGPLALGPRLGGRLGHWVAAIARRLATDPQPTPGRIDLRLVSEIGSSIRIALPHDQLGPAALESWLGTHLIDRIPGSDHEGE